MPVQRAGYTVTMFLIDVSPSMGETKVLELPPGPNGEKRTRELTRLEWVLEFVMLKIQEMIFNGRKTDQCGVILFGTEETDNPVNAEHGGYEHIRQFIPIGQPNAQTMAKLKSLKPSTTIGDPIDAIVVGFEIQNKYLAKKPSWTRKIVLVTDGESPMEIEDWDSIAGKLNDKEIHLTIVGVDFDDEEMPFFEENKSEIKRNNEDFYNKEVSGKVNQCVLGTAAFALQECSKPDIKMTKSTLMNSKLRIGDVETRSDEAIELHVKTSKATAIARPPSMKKFAKRRAQLEDMDIDEEKEYVMLDRRTQYYVDRSKGEGVEDTEKAATVEEEPVEKEDLVRGYKYGASFVPVDEEDQFERLEPNPGIDICGFFPAENFRRDWAMGEVQYVWADPTSAREQVAFSSIVQAMAEKEAMAIARWVSRSDPKMGVLMPRVLDNIDCFLWVQVPFADDLREYTFRSLDRLTSKKGERLSKHPNIPTEEQQQGMDAFVDAMDLMAADKDDEGNKIPWFNPVESYNPAIHRIKQALFHGAITSDLSTNPLPPPHPDLTKYFSPPPKVIKRAHDVAERCKSVFKVKQAPPKAPRRARKDAHMAGEDDDELIDLGAPAPTREYVQHPSGPATSTPRKVAATEEGSETEDESDQETTLATKPSTKPPKSPPLSARKPPLPTPARSPPSQSPPPSGVDHTPGRIISNSSPLTDFQQNIKQGDIVSQAVRDLGTVIKEVIMKPFASRRHSEMLECMKEMRRVALEEDEIPAWNDFLRGLKNICLNHTPSNKDFWGEIQKIGRPISLISSKEAKKLGGKSDVTEGTAVDFVEEDED